jgi:hypothetical protein
MLLGVVAQQDENVQGSIHTGHFLSRTSLFVFGMRSVARTVLI